MEQILVNEVKTVLAIGKNFDLLFRREFVLNFTSRSNYAVLDFRIKLIGVEVLMDSQILRTEKLTNSKIKITLPRIFHSGEKVKILVKLLVDGELQKIGELRLFQWSLGEIDEVWLSDPQYFMANGFTKITEKRTTNSRLFILNHNISKGLHSHIAESRGLIIGLSKNKNPSYLTSVNIYFRSDFEQEIRDLTISIPQSDNKQESIVEHVTGTDAKFLVTQDDQRNWVLKFSPFRISSGYTTIKVYVRIRLKSMSGTIDFRDLGKLKNIAVAINKDPTAKKYISDVPDAFGLSHPYVVKVANAAKRKESVFDAHRLLFEIANRELKYSITPGRRSSSWALQNKTGDCSEFAYVLVAFHRAAGIPSRVIEGNIITPETENGLSGHAWVEFLTPKGWMECDPTWGIVIGSSPLHIRYLIHTVGESPPNISFKNQGRVDLKWHYALER